MKKKFFIFAAAIFLAAMSMSFYGLNLYTKDQTKAAVSKAVQYQLGDWETDPKPLQLGDLLYINVRANITDGKQAGEETPDSYKTGWRSIAAQNPWLVHEAIKTYGPLAMRMFQDSLAAWHKGALSPTAAWRRSGLQSPERVKEKWLETRWHSDFDPPTADSAYRLQVKYMQKWKTDSTRIEQNLASWNQQKFWNEQRHVLRQYKKLAQALVALPDSTLGTYLREVEWEQGSNYDESRGRLAVKTQTWLVSKGLIGKMPKGSYVTGSYDFDQGDQIWYKCAYPVDLILLTRRISKDYASITGPKRFLKQVILACDEFDKIIPNN